MPLDGKKHGGHRDRLRERFIHDGLDGFEEHNILEMLLFYTIPQKDTNELAHSLLDRFGSLEGVFRATPEKLMQVEGVGEHTALFLGLFSDLMDSYITDRRQNEIISGIENITAFALRKLSYAPVESLLVFFFDNKQFLLSWHCLQEGSVTPEEIDIRTMVHMVMGTNATYVMMARNNPKGMAKLIKKDNAIALTVSEAMRSIGVLLYDYIVVSRDRSYVTMLGNAYTAPTNDASAERVGDPS